MTKPSFATMSDTELRTYVLANRDDEEAFHVYCDRLYAKPGIKVTSREQLEQLIREKQRIVPSSQTEPNA
jgi:hypothetical protein